MYRYDNRYVNSLSLSSRFIAGAFAGLLVLPALTVQATSRDIWNVEGAHGELQVQGSLNEGACRLDMVSAYQDINLGDTPLSDLAVPGDQGIAVNFTLRLRDCIRKGGNQPDVHSGGFVWDPLQPAVTVSFSAVADDSSPQLVKANGVSGMGLRIIDSQGRDVRLGERGLPQFVTPGGDELVYSVRPERTTAPLVPGSYRSVVNFSLDYD